MKTFEKVYKIVHFVPRGKVITYKQVSDLTGINNPKIVGFALHVNKNIINVPCHRVVKNNGTFAKGYALGGKKAQMEKLKNEGVCFLTSDKINFEKSLYKPSLILILYFKMLFIF